MKRNHIVGLQSWYHWHLTGRLRSHYKERLKGIPPLFDVCCYLWV